MGLVQVFRDSPCPPLLAGYLLDLVLEEWSVSGQIYLLHLLARHEDARACGDTQQMEALEPELREHCAQIQLPERWHLDRLFGDEGFETFGDGIYPVWASALVQLCALEQFWTRTLLGLPAREPYRLSDTGSLSGLEFDQPNRSRTSSAASSPLAKDSSVQW